MEQLGNITLYNADCMDIMRGMPGKAFDLAIVDPPYGIGADKPSKKPNRVKQANGKYLNVDAPNYTHKDWDIAPNKEYFDELFRVSKHQIIFGANYFDYPFRGGAIVWDKLNGESDQMGVEIAYQSFNNRTDVVYCMWSGMFQGIYAGRNLSKALVQQGNKRLNEVRIHPTQKPIKLYKWMLTEYAKPGYKILDTNHGSGSLSIACDELGYELTAVEIDSEYYDSSRQRLIAHQQQQKFF